jgi:hypothetical protein
MKYLLSVLFFSSLALSSSYAQYNFESCYAFWKLTGQLRSGNLPSEEEWGILKQTEGYRRKNISNERWKAFRDNVTLVFTPGNEEEVKQKMAGNIDLRWIRRFAQEEDQLKQYIAEIEQLHIMDSAIFQANRILPRKYRQCFRPPTINFLLFDYDANGNSQGIVMDLLVSHDMEKFRPGIFSGHEMLHYALAYCRIKTRRFKHIPDQHLAVFIAVNGISEEGIADLIDKPDLLFNEQSTYMLRDTFHTIYVNSAEYVRKINDALEKLSVQQTTPYTTMAYWQTLMPVSGHIPGLFMGQVIRRNGLEQKLKDRIDNPFQFFYLYNDAARNDQEKPPVFSRESIRYLKLLEKRYLK